MPGQYDGIICFGGADWWYHNHGHYDIQMCRQFSKRIPVLYVNSIGVRTPSLGEGGMFFRRVIRKVNSWRRGYCQIDERFAVLSPIAIPGRIGRAISNPILRLQIARARRRMGIDAALIWVETPTAEPILHRIDHVGLVYQRTDRYEEFDGVDRGAIVQHDRVLKAEAAVTLFCSSYLFDREKADCRAEFVDHGVHFDRFEAAGIVNAEPPPLVGLRRPRAGFVGGLDDHTFDIELFLAVARALPDVEFVLVGGSSLPTEWCTLPNVVHIGQVDYEAVPEFMAACDVLIMPWRQNDWIKACNPVKLKEYLAVGRPIVSTWFEELKRYEGLVRVASGSRAFAAAIVSALADVEGPEAGRNQVRFETWAAKAAVVETHLHAAGLEPQSSTTRPDKTRAARRD
jgi:glycosyltransferase involved in cell wall biosynthesis